MPVLEKNQFSVQTLIMTKFDIKMNLPESVTLIEVGPRDGFQFEKKIIPTKIKLEAIRDLLAAGIKHIQVVSFVHPELVPQMADAEELLNCLPVVDGVAYSGIVLNIKGVERARHAGLMNIDISISASDTHSRKNAGMSFEEALKQGSKMIRLAKKYNMRIRAGVQCAFGCVYEGKIPRVRVLKIFREFIKLNVDQLAVADTTGMANPLSIKKLLSDLIPIAGKIPVALHLHDTRGLGLVNVMAALECGIIHFDTALAGMGGCPFVPGATGNIATEDTAYLMESLNIKTGIDIKKVARCSRQLEAFFKKPFSGKMYKQLQ